MNRIRDHLSEKMLLLLPLVLALGCQSAPKVGPGDYSATMAVRTIAVSGQRPDQYMVESLVWRQRAGGEKELVSGPEMMVAEDQEAVIEAGTAAEKHTRCAVLVRELNGRKTATATIDCFEDGATVWHRTLETEALLASD